MPSVKRGFVFKYFDKFICGLVGLGLLVGIVFALSRANALPEQIRPQVVNSLVTQINQRLQAAARPMTAVIPNPTTLEKVAAPPAVRNHMMIWPLPVLYAPIKVGLDKDFELQFKHADGSPAPLGEGTVTVQAAQGMAAPVDIIAHPVDGDYSRVKLHSRSYVGPEGIATANVVGYEGRIAHIYPVIVDSSVNKTAYAPSLKVTDEQGTVKLDIIPDPRIESEGVGIAYYEVWRRAWSDPLGKYELVDEVSPGSGKSLSGPARATPVAAPSSPLGGPVALPFMGPTGMPGEYPGAAPTTPAATQPAAPSNHIGWTDPKVLPGDKYSYKVRAIGNNTFPTEGEYCDPVMAAVLPDIDFRFSLTTADSVRFDVVKAAGAKGANKDSFWEAVGDAIGGISKTGGSFLPGYALVDFQSDATQPDKPGLPGRVVYADDKGNLRVLWNGETRAAALWDRLRNAPPATGTRMPFGFPVGRTGRPGAP